MLASTFLGRKRMRLLTFSSRLRSVSCLMTRRTSCLHCWLITAASEKRACCCVAWCWHPPQGGGMDKYVGQTYDACMAHTRCAHLRKSRESTSKPSTRRLLRLPQVRVRMRMLDCRCVLVTWPPCASPRPSPLLRLRCVQQPKRQSLAIFFRTVLFAQQDLAWAGLQSDSAWLMVHARRRHRHHCGVTGTSRAQAPSTGKEACRASPCAVSASIARANFSLPTPFVAGAMNK